MKTMTISYRMYRNNKTETTADSITLPMTKEHADQIMAGEAVEHLDILLDRLALLQGCDTGDALTVYNHSGDGFRAPSLARRIGTPARTTTDPSAQQA